MLKKLLLLSFAALALAACNDDEEGVQYATSNPEIVDGIYSGRNMHFYGTATVSNTSDGSIHTDPEAWFEFAGGDKGLVIYMHQTRFAASMPSLEMRIYRIPYTPGEGATLSFTAESSVPQVRLPNTEGGGYSYQDMSSYTLTEVEGSVDNTLCRVAFTCTVPQLGTYRMEYEGRLLVKK